MQRSAHASITRFAPSPTGYLHLGHIASAIYVWGLGRRSGARVLLRIEDHDRQRCRPEYEQAIFEDLAWLGLVPDNATELQPGRLSSFRQSDCGAIYEEALARLVASHQVYACDCSRRQIALSADTSGEELRYAGRCRERGLPLDTPGTGLRIALPEDAITFTDLLLGPTTQVPEKQCGDPLLRDRHGQWTYLFAVVVDDLRHGVDLVIRGQDLTSSTGRQILLGRWLGRPHDARYYHHPLICDASGRKLGKRFYSEAVAKRRAAGEPPEMVLGAAAYAVGLRPNIGPLPAAELPNLFSSDGGGA